MYGGGDGPSPRPSAGGGGGNPTLNTTINGGGPFHYGASAAAAGSASSASPQHRYHQHSPPSHAMHNSSSSMHYGDENGGGGGAAKAYAYASGTSPNPPPASSPSDAPASSPAAVAYSSSFTEQSLVHAVEDCVALYLYTNAIAIAERLFDVFPTNANLYTLANCFLRSGDGGTAYRLLKHHFPFRAGPYHHKLTYLLGVACGVTGKYSECLAYMRGIPLPPLADGDPSAQCVSPTTSSPSHLATSDRISAAAVLHWIGQCEARQGNGRAATYWASACCYNPSLVHTMECSVGHGGMEAGARAVNAYAVPIVPCYTEREVLASRGGGEGGEEEEVEEVVTVVEEFIEGPLSLMVGAGRCNVTVLRPSPVSSGCDASPPPTTMSVCSTAHGLDATRLFLSPYANISAALLTYNCVEAFAAVSGAKGAALLQQHRGGPVKPKDTVSSFSNLSALGSSSSSSASYWCSLVKSQCAFHTSDHGNCATYFAEAIKAAPWRLNEPLLVNYSTSLWHLHDMHGLGTLAQTLLTELGPSNAVSCAVSGNYYSRLREQKAAVQLFERSVSIDPTLSWAQTLLGYESLADTKYPKASEHFYAALRANPRCFMAIAGLGEMALRKGNVSIARDEFYKALSINPLPAVMLRYAATFHRRDSTAEELRTAVQLYDEVLGRQPRHPPAQLRRAAALLQLGDAHGALDEVELLRQHGGPEEAEVFILRARCLAALGDKDGAIAALNKAIGLDNRTAGDAKSLLDDLQHQ